MWKFLCYFVHAQHKSEQILSSGNIIIEFSTPSFVRTPNFCLQLVWFGQKITLNFAIYREQHRSNECHQRCHLYISDDSTPTIDYLNLKLCRTQFKRQLKQLVKFDQIGDGEVEMFPKIGSLDMESPSSGIRKLLEMAFLAYQAVHGRKVRFMS